MSIIECLDKKENWELFFDYKVQSDNFPEKLQDDLRRFIDNGEYDEVVNLIKDRNPFPYPSVKKLNKKHTEKKRVVFTFDRCENYVLKLIMFLLGKYDFLFSDNLYSFRQKIGVKHAIRNIVNTPGIASMYSYKVDIHDYFNSVDTEIMTEILYKNITDDEPLKQFVKELLENPYCTEDGKVTEYKKGIMAGMPVSGFLANLYLAELDGYFAKNHVLYARYSDDIIVFAPSAEKIAQYENIIKDFLTARRLEINPKKEFRTKPGETWEFLGFAYSNGKIDISEIALQKLKAKMRRKARALLRWKNRNSASDERAIKAFIRHFNRKLYDNPIHNDITWCRWYFPVITSDEGLKMIDEYAIACIRYISTGRHTKANYNLRYETIKKYGYKSLVNEYYKFMRTIK